MRGFIIALTFLTTIPFPAPSNVTQKEFTQSQYYYPVVGLLIGLILWGISKLAGAFLPPLIIGALILICELILTGGLHLDGFMDSMDGLLSARSPERMLEIMKDSRVGAHASMSLAGLLLLKFTLLASLKPSMLVFVIIMPVLSRWTEQIAIIGFPYARQEGLGKGFHETSLWLVFLLEGLAIIAFSTWLLGAAGPIALGASVLFVSVYCWRVSRLLGGLTGDIYGAVIELTEVVALLVAFPFLR